MKSRRQRGCADPVAIKQEIERTRRMLLQKEVSRKSLLAAEVKLISKKRRRTNGVEIG